jgi:hypothetical protein
MSAPARWSTMKRFLVMLALAAFAVPAFASDPPGTPSAEKQCRDQRTSIGAQAFKDLYGTNHNKSNAFGKCVSKTNKTLDKNASEAKSSCKTEQAADAAAFKEKYGTNKNKSNAYGKCVSALAKASDQESQSATINAAKQCKDERKADAAAFKDKYGTNKNKRNAFGKCVSAIAKAQQDAQPTT